MAFPEWYLYFFVGFLMLLSVFFVPFTLRIKLHNLRDDNNILIRVRFMLFRSLKFFTLHKLWHSELEDIPTREIYQRIQKIGRGLTPGQKLRYGYVGLIRLGGAVYWREMTVMIKAGTGDPAVTGLMVGLSQASGGVISKYLRRYWRFGKNAPLLLIYPSFAEEELKFIITLEFTTGIARFIKHILFPGYNRKEVTRRWQNNILSRT